MLISSFVMGIWGGMKKQFLMISLSLGALGLSAMVAGLLPPSMFIIFVVMAFLMGSTGTFFNVPYSAYIQRTVEQESIGKVFTLVISAMSLTAPVGLMLAGPVSELIGIAGWFVVSGAVMVLTGVACYFATRKYDFLPAQSPADGGDLTRVPEE